MPKKGAEYPPNNQMTISAENLQSAGYVILLLQGVTGSAQRNQYGLITLKDYQKILGYDHGALSLNVAVAKKLDIKVIPTESEEFLIQITTIARNLVIARQKKNRETLEKIRSEAAKLFGNATDERQPRK